MHDDKIAKDFNVEGGSVLHVSRLAVDIITIIYDSFLPIIQLVLALRGGQSL